MSDLPKAPTQYGVYFTHRKGGVYKVIATGMIEATLTPCVIYQNMKGGAVWVRPYAEFNDGRFVCLDGPLTKLEQNAQGNRCGCNGADDMCPCQNRPDYPTLRARADDMKWEVSDE